MVVHITQATASAALVAILNRIDEVSATGGVLVVYSGTRPATADTALSGNTALISFTLPNPSFGAPSPVSSGAQATANAITAVAAGATGTAQFFRIYDGTGATGTVILDGSVTDTTGNGDLKLSTVNVVSGINVSVVSLNALMPNGT